jgi:Uri superfamily endonuclease
MLPDEPGTYALILRAPRSRTISVGKLGQFSFRAGWYAYAGSARGPGGLAARISRHASRSKPLHWHLDYLRSEVDCLEAWYATGSERRECAWAAALAQLSGASIPAPRFGASDCRCAAHLIYFAVRPALSTFAASVDGRVRRAVLGP